MQKFFTTISIIFLVILMIAALWVFTAFYTGLSDQSLISSAQLIC